MTLALVDRLPTENEREFARLRGHRGAFELANHLIQTREFFERQSHYWHAHLSQSPAWLWEQRAHLQWNKYLPQSFKKEIRPLYFFPIKENARSETICKGVWTIVQGEKPELCDCDDMVDVIPQWDNSSSMRVCPAAKHEDVCGSGLEKCIPIDARLQSTVRNLESDKESAAGRAISRLLTDLTFAQSRSLALAVITHQKWSQMQSTARTVMSRSSVELLTKWVQADPEGPARQIASVFKTDEMDESARAVFLAPVVPTRVRGARPLIDSQAEELLLTPILDPRATLQPLHPSQLGQNIWSWNANLLLTCQIPHFAPQVFQLPLPSPEQARDGYYFCTSCHLSLDKFTSDGRKQKKDRSEVKVAPTPLKDSSVKSCAVEHALQFLLGYRPNGQELTSLRKQGLSLLQQNNESLAATIRDLALLLGRQGDSE